MSSSWDCLFRVCLQPARDAQGLSDSQALRDSLSAALVPLRDELSNLPAGAPRWGAGAEQLIDRLVRRSGELLPGVPDSNAPMLVWGGRLNKLPAGDLDGNLAILGSLMLALYYADLIVADERALFVVQEVSASESDVFELRISPSTYREDLEHELTRQVRFRRMRVPVGWFRGTDTADEYEWCLP